MSEYLLNEEYARNTNREIVSTAMGMLNGQINFLFGARALAALSFKVPKMDSDPDFLKFIVIASETDDFPLGDAQQLWDKSALSKLTPQILEAEAWARKCGEEACRSLVIRFDKD